MSPSVRSVEGRFLKAGDVDGLRSQAIGADAAGVDAVFVSDSPMGDPVVLAASLSSTVRRSLLGIRTTLVPEGRHPAILARELTCLDLISGGRTVLCFRPPFADGLADAMKMCRNLWREGKADGDAGTFRVRGAVNRPRPTGRTPLLALDLTGGEVPTGELVAATDLVLRPGDDPEVCRIETT